MDDFISNLWNVHQAVKREGYVQVIDLVHHPSKYLTHVLNRSKGSFIGYLSLRLHGSQGSIKLGSQSPNQASRIQYNCLIFRRSLCQSLWSSQVRFHIPALKRDPNDHSRHLLSIFAYPSTNPPLITGSSLPPNPSIASISRGIATAHEAYGHSKNPNPMPLCTLFVVQDPENNAFDQHALATILRTEHDVLTFRLPFFAVLSRTTIPSDLSSRPLIYTPPHSPSTPYEVTTLYFRAGYSPAEYVSEDSWKARLHLERSAAIKCPSILTHLAGSKKIQQVLATPSSPHLSHFLSSTSSAAYIDRIRNTFTAIYPLDDTPEGKYAIRMATDPDKARNYVLKPQREGGGNNIYGLKIPPFIKSLSDDSKKYRSHILMELIEPPALRNSILRNGEIKSGEVIGELGVFGVCLWRSGEDSKDGPDVLANWEAGHLLRTKGRESEEGGVAAGFGAIDSVCLIDL